MLILQYIITVDLSKEKEVAELQQTIEDDASKIAALERKIRELEVKTQLAFDCYILLLRLK